MSTENTAGTMAPANGNRYYINVDAYKPLLRDYCEKMVEKGVLERVDVDHAIGKYRGNAYKLPNGKIIKLDRLANSRSGVPLSFVEMNPETRAVTKNRNGKVMAGDIVDLVASVKGVNRYNPDGYRACRVELVDELGPYVGNQVVTHDDKINKKAVERANQKNNLTDDQINDEARIRKYVLKEMNDKIMDQIQKTGTLFGREEAEVPVILKASDIAYFAQGKKWKKEDYIGRLPAHLEPATLTEIPGFDNKRIKKLDGNQMTGLLYVAAMQDGNKDKRYMDVDELLNGTRKPSKGVTVGKGKDRKKHSAHWIYGRSFGFRNNPVIDAPKIAVEEKVYTWGKLKGQSYEEYSLEDPIKAEVNHQILNAVWVDHAPHDHLVQKPFVNVSQIALRPVDNGPNNHSGEDFIIPATVGRPTTIEGKAAYMDKVANRAIRFYGRSIRDVEAFKKDPIGEMRKIIEMGTKLNGGNASIDATENDHIKNYGMRAFQRELTLDYIMRTCGYYGGITIPEKDRGAICRWLSDDFTNAKDPPGKRLIEATVAMDMNNKALRGMSLEEKELVNEEVKNRPKFQHVSMALQSDYTMNDGTVLTKGTGAADWSKPIKGEDAFTLLNDICYKDKVAYGRPDVEGFNKQVRFDLKIGDQEFKNVTLTLGRLDTGNEKTVADSLMNLLSKKEKEAAYSRDAINKELDDWDKAKKNKFIKEEFMEMSKEDFVNKAKTKFDEFNESLHKTFNNFKIDEINYREVKRINGEKLDYDCAKMNADVYRYEVPTQNVTLLYEAYGASNIVRIQTPDPKKAMHMDSLVVELRRPLDPVKEIVDDKLQNRKDELGNAVFYDLATKRERPTITLNAIPYRKEEEWLKNNEFENKFSLEYTENGEVQQFKGNEARDKLLETCETDRITFNREKEGFRSIDNYEKVNVVAKWDGETIFEKEARIGSKAFSNVHSVEELVSSQKDSLSEQGKAALAEMLVNDRVEEKYSPNRNINTELTKNNKILDEKEIDKILKAPKKVEEYEKAENREGTTKIDRLETEAMLNFKDTEQSVVNHIVDGLIKDMPERNKDTLKELEVAFKKERPEMEAALKKSLERKEVQKKFNVVKGLQKKPSSNDLQK